MARRSAPSLIASIAAFAICGLLALACDSGTQEPASPAPAESAAVKPESPAPSAPERTAQPSAAPIDPSRLPTELPEGVEAAIPASFPKDVPVYPGSQPAQGKGLDSSGIQMSALQLVTGDSQDRVADFYRSEFGGSGWSVEEGEAGGNGTSFRATKGKCTAQVLIVPTDDGGSDLFFFTEC